MMRSLPEAGMRDGHMMPKAAAQSVGARLARSANPTRDKKPEDRTQCQPYPRQHFPMPSTQNPIPAER